MLSPTLIAAGLMLSWGGVAGAGPRVLSLDQCADQYVLALTPRTDIVGLSRRATNPDSYLRRDVGSLPMRRSTAESVLAARPDVVVRFWGGDARLLQDLRRRGVRVVSIEDSRDFDGVRANVRHVAAGLGEAAAGERLVTAMDEELARSAGAGKGAGALYITSGGDTAGPGTLVDAMIRAAGYVNLATRPGYSTVRLEMLVLHPPSAVVLGFFDQPLDAAWRWSPGRTPVLQRLSQDHTVVSLRGAILGCPAWFAADGASALATASGARHPR